MISFTTMFNLLLCYYTLLLFDLFRARPIVADTVLNIHDVRLNIYIKLESLNPKLIQMISLIIRLLEIK